jgi:hypothetical protein
MMAAASQAKQQIPIQHKSLRNKSPRISHPSSKKAWGHFVSNYPAKAIACKIEADFSLYR